MGLCTPRLCNNSLSGEKGRREEKGREGKREGVKEAEGERAQKQREKCLDVKT